MQNNCLICLHLNGSSFLKITEFPDSILYLNQDQFFKGYCFLEYKEHVREFFDLSDEARKRLMNHVCQAARALQKAFSPDKINYELLGNKVPHLHWHIIPRYLSDPAWPEPIWRLTRIPEKISNEDARGIISEIQKYL